MVASLMMVNFERERLSGLDQRRACSGIEVDETLLALTLYSQLEATIF